MTSIHSAPTRPRWWASIERGEIGNAVTHGTGFLLSAVGSVVMAAHVVPGGSPWRIAGCMIFASTLVAVYALSTLSHAVSAPRYKRFFEMLDQAFIFLLIVGTFTPFVLAYLRTGPWLSLLAVMWALALYGFGSKIRLGDEVGKTSVWLQLLLGWLPISTVPALVHLVPAAALWWMLIGGLFYTVGTIFLILDRHVQHFHIVWHLFVMAGSICHYSVIFQYIARQAGPVLSG